MCSEDERFGSVEECGAMARGDGDAPLGVKRDDRRSVKRRSHMAFPATFSYLLPLYVQWARRSSGKTSDATMTYMDFSCKKIYRISIRFFNDLSIGMKVNCKKTAIKGQVP
jgi:hypothetical protein